MNTFIVDNSPIICAKLLDNKRLGKQRVESCQLLNAIEARKNNLKVGWVSHPATLMWIGFENQLRYYTNCMIDEWVERGFKNTISKFNIYETNMPEWFSWKELQESHKASLLRKDYNYYSKFFIVDDIYLEYKYVWPTQVAPEYYLKNVCISSIAKKHIV